MTAEVHKDDYGTTIIITLVNGAGTALDVSDATLIEFLFEKPSGTVITKTGNFVSDGSDGKVKYTFAEDVLDADGRWKVQVRLTTATALWHGDIEKIRVRPNLA